MSLHAYFDRLTTFLTSLECLGVMGQRDAFANECLESGGTYAGPDAGIPGRHLFEISLHGVVAWGGSEDQAISNWIEAARAKVSGVEDDGFITVHPPFPDPRNHHEEIANARAAQADA